MENENETPGKKFAILETDKITGKKLLYTSMTKFCEAKPQYKRERIAYYITRYKKPFEDERRKLERVQFF